MRADSPATLGGCGNSVSPPYRCAMSVDFRARRLPRILGNRLPGIVRLAAADRGSDEAGVDGIAGRLRRDLDPRRLEGAGGVLAGHLPVPDGGANLEIGGERIELN